MVSVRAGYGDGGMVPVGSAGAAWRTGLPAVRSECAHLRAPGRREDPSFLARRAGAGPAAGTWGVLFPSPRDALGLAWNAPRLPRRAVTARVIRGQS